jgi:hypothetical protein
MRSAFLVVVSVVGFAWVAGVDAQDGKAPVTVSSSSLASALSKPTRLTLSTATDGALPFCLEASADDAACATVAEVRRVFTADPASGLFSYQLTDLRLAQSLRERDALLAKIADLEVRIGELQKVAGPIAAQESNKAAGEWLTAWTASLEKALPGRTFDAQAGRVVPKTKPADTEKAAGSGRGGAGAPVSGRGGRW